MSDEHQPEAVWVFPEKKKNNGRIWLIVGLAVAALVIVGVVLLFVIPRDSGPEPTPSPTDSAIATPTPTPTPTPTATATEAPAPETTPPPVPDPDISTFVGQVEPRLDDAVRGLQLIKDNMDLGAQIVDSLQNDAIVLSDTPAPGSISADWSDAVAQYASKLSDLRNAYDSGSDVQGPLDAADTALQTVRAVVGL